MIGSRKLGGSRRLYLLLVGWKSLIEAIGMKSAQIYKRWEDLDKQKQYDPRVPYNNGSADKRWVCGCSIWNLKIGRDNILSMLIAPSYVPRTAFFVVQHSQKELSRNRPYAVQAIEIISWHPVRGIPWSVPASISNSGSALKAVSKVSLRYKTEIWRANTYLLLRLVAFRGKSWTSRLWHTLYYSALRPRWIQCSR